MSTWIENADYLNEKFEANPGYDDGSWSVNGVPDPDEPTSTVSNPSGWGTQCLEIVSLGNDGVNCVRNLGADRAITYFRMEFILTASGLVNDSDRHLLANTYTAAYGNVWWVTVSRVSGVAKIVIIAYDTGALALYTGFPTVSLNTKYNVEIKWDATNDLWGWKIDGIAQPNNIDSTDPVTSEGTLTSTHPTSLRILSVGARAFGTNYKSFTAYIDKVAFNSNKWVDERGAGLAHRVIII